MEMTAPNPTISDDTYGYQLGGLPLCLGTATATALIGMSWPATAQLRPKGNHKAPA